MNDQYEQYEIIKGKRYRYDPDYDAYYRAYTQEENSKQTRETLWIFGITLFVLLVGTLYEIYVK